jgi:hypothetical protein
MTARENLRDDLSTQRRVQQKLGKSLTQAVGASSQATIRYSFRSSGTNTPSHRTLTTEKKMDQPFLMTGP